ncbi:MAG: TAT-variant-translocated molybdopterin oxidoreductase [Acidobacteriota bacterium]|nr:TAT-variant-translocated molybdopterin oxidoreductase [Acidobacteriota bacterium]
MSPPIDIKAVRARLAQPGGPQVWSSLEAVAETPEFKDYLHREFPSNASEWLDPVGRRSFLKLMSASMALAGVTACTVQPTELIVPYVRQPEEEIPGKPLFFATAMTLGGVATGVLVESHEGRPTKIEGNPDHPASQGATDLYAQGSVLTLYDPDRSQTITQLGEIRPWNAVIAAVRGGLSAQSGSKGAGLRILTETVSSPTLAAQIQQVLALQPNAKWIQWEPMPRDNARAGARAAFGQYLEPLYDLTKADVILSLDADFLASEGAATLRYSRQFASRRRVEESADNLNRLYVVESNHTVTGGRADNRLPIKSSQIEAFARAVAAQVGVAGSTGTAPAGTAAFVDAVAKDLVAHRGRVAVMAGDAQPPAVHVLAHAMNAALGPPTLARTPASSGEVSPERPPAAAADGVVTYVPTPEAVPSEQHAALRELVDDINGGRVQMLVIIGESNPVFSAPADLKFAEAMSKVSLRVHSGLFFDETATQSHWHVPAAHYLEAWSDARTIDGTVSIVQPLIQPLYGGKSAHEVIATLSDRPERNGYDVVREFWSAQPQGSTDAAVFEKTWRKWLHDGLIVGSAFTPVTPAVAGDAASRTTAAQAADGVEVNFRRDPTIYDGRFANNGWLQELPKPMTKLTWDNAALMAPATAEALHLENGDMIEVEHEGRKLVVPAWILPGHAKDSITIPVGYGRTRAGRLGTGTGFDTYTLRGSTSPWFGAAKITKTGDDYDLVGTQDHWSIEGRNIVRSATLEDFKAKPAFAKEMEHGVKLDKRISLYADKAYRGDQWGMAIDMNACTGCMSCVIACVAENNIPVVGKVQVGKNREMHWLRIDRYFAGNLDTPDTYFQPMPCQQCENAPCEVVCPVSATVHSDEGLNDMVYNRCVGTRYCSNNCPWKVRRFNFLLFQDWNTPQFKLQRNPDVTVRSRGIMEKCTYCVQRINAARIQAKREDRGIRDGEIVTACQAVCPTEAIVFGNINDPNSKVAKLKSSPRNYTMLEDLNTRPRTTYLAAVRNPNPGLPHNAMVGGHHETTESHDQPGGEH